MSEPENAGIIRDEKGRFVPGISGNPAGKPPGSVSIVARLKKIFVEEPELFEQYCRDILSDPDMRKTVLEQIDSKPKQPIDMDLRLPQSLIDLIRNVADTGTNQTIPEENQE